ncbi:MAG: hypothetical protein ACLFR2_05505 [Candidatus Kapaibacterium sp.]
MKFLKYIIIVLFVVGSGDALAQSGMKFGEMARKLDPYFDKALILDVKNQLPQGTDYSIWGWDVGDFSGDGYYDVAMTVKFATDKKRIVHVYMFVDIEGYLVNVGTFTYEFIDLPLEIGIIIKNNACLVTKKNKENDWEINGHTFDNGSLVRLDDYRTKQILNLTHERYVNYLELHNTEKYILTRNGMLEFSADYMVIPSYNRGRKVYKGYNDVAEVSTIEYVHHGAYDWEGFDDCSFKVSSAYDDEYLYMTVEVNDDKIITQKCDTCIADYVDVWLDVFSSPDSLSDRFSTKIKDRIIFRSVTDSGLYRFSVYPGDFLEQKPYMKISTTDEMQPYQSAAAKDMKVVTDYTNQGYILKFRIPFIILGFQGNPMKEKYITELGCTVVVNDYDNEFRPEEKTEIASSKFSSMNPSTYGSLMLIPPGKWYGKSSNIYEEEILRYLSEYGF